MKRLVLNLGLLIILGICAGTIYEYWGERQDRIRQPQIGRSVDVGGRSLNIYCSGEGAPVVILEAPGGPGYVWAHIQPEIATFTTACWYDRAGEGWSDPGPFPRTAAAIAKDLHTLLGKSKISPPYVLVGYSFGGLVVRVYGGTYLDEVAGIVLVDSAHEDEPQRAPKFFLAHSPPRFLRYPLFILVKASANLGLVRITSRSSTDLVQSLRRQPKSVVNEPATGFHIPESYAEAHAVPGLADRPMIVLTAGKAQPWPNPDMRKQADEYQQIWIREMQSQLARLSTRGKQIVVENSDHGILEEAPEAVINAVHEVVDEVRVAR
jgi:pimeloyl-ACP methyl ester carboxylesterase